MDCSSPGSSVHGISQAGILEWAASSFSSGSSLNLLYRQVESLPQSHRGGRSPCRYTSKFSGRGRSQDGGGIGRGDHFLFYKFIERTTARWTKFTKQLLIASGGHQAPRKAAHCLQREVGQGYWRLKRETRERGMETRPGKGVLIEEVSNHQETLALAGPGEVFRSRRAT